MTEPFIDLDVPYSYGGYENGEWFSVKVAWLSKDGISVLFQVFGPLNLQASDRHELATAGPEIP